MSDDQAANKQNQQQSVTNTVTSISATSPVVRAIPPIRWFQVHPRYWGNGVEPEPKLQWFDGLEWVDVPKIYGA